jgi:hypothetical protein
MTWRQPLSSPQPGRRCREAEDEGQRAALAKTGGWQSNTVLVILTKVRTQFVRLGDGGCRKYYSCKSLRYTPYELGPDLRQDDGAAGPRTKLLLPPPHCPHTPPRPHPALRRELKSLAGVGSAEPVRDEPGWSDGTKRPTRVPPGLETGARASGKSPRAGCH